MANVIIVFTFIVTRRLRGESTLKYDAAPREPEIRRSGAKTRAAKGSRKGTKERTEKKERKKDGGQGEEDKAGR